MKIADRYPGESVLFQGKRTVLLKSIPLGASIADARITITPVNSGGVTGPSTDTISFASGNEGGISGQSGVFATKSSASSGASSWVEVNFHGRRMLVSVNGTNLSDTTLQVDIGGGSFVDINSNGAFKGPDDNAFALTGNSSQLPRLSVQRIKLTAATASPIPDVSAITILNTPSNVRLALGALPDFWMQPGDLINPQTTPDFTALLQSILAEAENKNGYYQIPLTIQSDTLARLNIQFSIEYQQQISVLPEGVPEAQLQYGYNGASDSAADLLTVSVPANARVLPKQTSAKVIGSFNGERIAQGPIGPVAADSAVAINPQLAQAYLIELGDDVTGSAFDFLLQPLDEAVRLQLDLREDLDGKPESASLLEKPVDFAIDRKTSPAANWSNVKLPDSFRFEERVQTRKLWLILQSLAGQAQWIAKPIEAGESAMMQSKDGGLSWRKMLVDGSGMAAQYRLRNTPANFTVPIHLQVGEGDKARNVSLDRFQALGRVDFALDFDDVANAINSYLGDNRGQGCPLIEHLANGDFSQTYEPSDTKSLPVEWELTGGELNLRDGGGIILGGDELNEVTGLSQIAPVMPGCRYQLEFYAAASLDDAVVEVIWLADGCDVAQVERVPIPRTVIAGTASVPISTTALPALSANRMLPTRVRLQAPQNVSQAEVRFKVPEEISVAALSISFKASNELISNGDLQQIDFVQRELVGWQFDGDVEEIDFQLNDGGVTLLNHSAETFALRQTIAVEAERPFQLAFTGGSATTINPAIELRWKSDGAATASSPIIETITPDSLNQHQIQGQTPVGVNQLELALTLAPQAGLSINSISLQQAEMIDVPLHLISQAPGQLTLSGLQVAYETIDPEPLAMPQSGLCMATQADQEPGDECEGCCCDGESAMCPMCREPSARVDVRVVRTPANRPATVGRCINCGTEIIRLGGMLDTTADVFPARREIVVRERQAVSASLPVLNPIRSRAAIH